MRMTLLAIAATFSIHGAALAATPLEADALGKALTPAGAERAGNKEGTIPAWEGKDSPAAGWVHGKLRGEFWAHKAEKPLFSIDASNVDKHAERLTPGQVQFVKQTKDYRMDVYASKRNCGTPDWLAANAKKNATEAKIAANGWGLEHANLPGVPFPIPKTGIEAMWNFIMRYRGNAVEWADTIAAVSPRPGQSQWIETHGPQGMFFPWGAKGATTPTAQKNVQLLYAFNYTAPTALAGQSMFMRFNFDSASETFYYFPGQRRVRRLPTYAYDAPQIGFENQYTVDEIAMFWGDPDRYDWKIVGKKEVYVPYNAFGMYDFNAKLHDVYQEKFVNNANRRYELHRMWVVEGNVKAGTRHSAPKKVFYFDEDSWQNLVNEDYDQQGKLWKVRESYPIPVWELGSCDAAPFVAYDVINGRYLQDQTAVSTGKDIQWLPSAVGKRYRDDYYTQENLRALSER